MIDHWARQVRQQLEELDHALPASVQHDIGRLCEIVEASYHYTFRRSDLSKLAEQLEAVEDLDSLAEYIAVIAASCGFDYVSIFLMQTGNNTIFSRRVCTSLPQDWLLRYDEKQYQFGDPVVLKALTSDESFLFSDLPPLPPFIADFWSDARAFGVGREGCCFPYFLDEGVRIAVSFISTRPEAQVRWQYQMNMQDLNEVGRMASEAFVELASTRRSERPKLGFEELRHLRTLMMSKDDGALAATLTDPRTRALRDDIYRKMGVRSAAQALIVVEQQHYIDELPFEDEEVAKSYPGALKRNI